MWGCLVVIILIWLIQLLVAQNKSLEVYSLFVIKKPSHFVLLLLWFQSLIFLSLYDTCMLLWSKMLYSKRFILLWCNSVLFFPDYIWSTADMYFWKGHTIMTTSIKCLLHKHPQIEFCHIVLQFMIYPIKENMIWTGDKFNKFT